MEESKTTKCTECGMDVLTKQYHPYAACLMFKQTRNSETTNRALVSVMDYGRKGGHLVPD